MDLLGSYSVATGGRNTFPENPVNTFAIMSKMDMQLCPFLLCNFDHFYFTLNTESLYLERIL